MTLNLNKTQIKTPLGVMLAIADDNKLIFLDFIDSKNIEKKTKEFGKAYINEENSLVLESIKNELNNYFLGKLKNFSTPIGFISSEFQKNAYEALITIPYGKTITYKEQAKIINRVKAVRAVANANGLNKLAIIVPCHRVIGSDKNLRGYAGGIERKKWLIEHEQKNLK